VEFPTRMKEREPHFVCHCYRASQGLSEFLGALLFDMEGQGHFLKLALTKEKERLHNHGLTVREQGARVLSPHSNF